MNPRRFWDPFIARRMLRAGPAALIAVALGTPATRIAADPEVVIREWDVPTPNSRPHDPAVAGDGALWYTGQAANTVGRLDPRTGQIREYSLRTANSGPHGLAADREGNIWFTANSAGYIGKLNTSTGNIVEYPMPDAAARDPHTPIFDAKGILWFTVQNGNFVGRVDPATGGVTLKRSPTPNSRPYGIAIDSAGVPFYCENGTNRIGRIDPETMEITEFVLPPAARPRRIAITPDDTVYYASDNGYLGRLLPKTGTVEEWLSPSGARAAPYGIAATSDGIVWYCETGVQPNRLVRFDPAAKEFQSWPIPSGGGVVRHMVATPERNLYLACSGVNKVAVAYLANRRAFTIPDRGGISWTSPGGAGAPLSGYARIQPDSGATAPAGFAVFSLREPGAGGDLISEASVPASAGIRSGRMYAEVEGPVKTGLAIANPNDRSAAVSFYFTDAGGRDFGHGSTTVAAGGQIAAFLDVPPFAAGPSIRGTFTFTSDVPVAAVALRGRTNERSEFLMTALPLVDLEGPHGAAPVFPHFADGDGWSTEVILVNGGDEEASGTVEFFGPGGQPASLTVDGTVGSGFGYTIARRSSRRLTTSGIGAMVQVGWARVNPAAGTRAPSGLLVFSLRRGGATVSEAGVAAAQSGLAFRLYAEVGEAGSIQTGVAIANLAREAVTVTFELTSLTGEAGPSGSVDLAPQGQLASFLTQVPGLENLRLPYQGVLRLSTPAAAGIAVAGLRGRLNARGDFLMTTTSPSRESDPAAAAELLFPHLADGGGYTTQFVLFSGSRAQSSSGAVRFVGQSGWPLGLWVR